MFPLGFFLLLAGVWLADSAYHGRPPLTTLEQILRDPGNMGTILDETKGTSTHTAVASFIAGGFPSAVGGTKPPKLPSGNAGAVVSFLERQVGKPYKWGAIGPNAFDCSGLGYAAYRSAGISIPRTTAGQIVAGHHVRKADLQPGDAVFPYPGHVFWYVGNGLCVEAPHTGEFVHLTKIYAFFTARRYLK